jgi:uncharacterized phage protein (TIGR02216 family)
VFAEVARRLAGLSAALIGWTPDTFWTATPEELATVIAALQPQGAAAADGAVLARLREAFPDE